MKTRLKKLLSKYKNKIFSFIAVIACIPLFTINSFAADVSPDAESDWFLLPFNYSDDFSQKGVFDSVLGTFNSAGGSYSGQYRHFSVSTDSSAVMPTFESGRSYLFYLTFTSVGTQVGSVSSASIRYNWGDWSHSLPLSSLNIIHNSSNYANGTNTYTTIWQLSNISTTHVINTASQFQINFGSSVTTDGRIGWALYALDITDNTESEVNSIISAINNQTDVLGNYIDKGNSSTGGIVSDNNSAIDNLDEVVSQYRETEQTFFDDFNTNQQAITSDIVGWSWGGLVNCADWVGSTLTDYYNNMGDFRQYIIYPLMLGIALFFLGRGGSIIGHLFRKPTETTVNTKSVFRRDGNTRYTTTTTSRQGGVWRK